MFSKKPCPCPIARIFTAGVLLRLSLAILFLIAGASKFMMGFTMIAVSTGESFATTILPVTFVEYFMYVLPFVEVALGLWLFSGFMKKSALSSTGLVLLMLAAGLLLKSDPSISQIYIYLIVTAMALHVESND